MSPFSSFRGYSLNNYHACIHLAIHSGLFCDVVRSDVDEANADLIFSTRIGREGVEVVHSLV
jgi:hypothetical protein